MRTRLQALGLLDRAIGATTDDELEALVAALGDDHREALERVVGGEPTPDGLRRAAVHGRLNGTIESIAMVLTDACLADCVEQLGDSADHPTADELGDVLPGVVERHGVGVTRMMLAATVAGEAPASAAIRHLLKHDDLVKLPPAPEPSVVPEPAPASRLSDDERAALKARRQEIKDRKQAAARARRQQSRRDRGRA